MAASDVLVGRTSSRISPDYSRFSTHWEQGTAERAFRREKLRSKRSVLRNQQITCDERWPVPDSTDWKRQKFGESLHRTQFIVSSEASQLLRSQIRWTQIPTVKRHCRAPPSRSIFGCRRRHRLKLFGRRHLKAVIADSLIEQAFIRITSDHSRSQMSAMKHAFDSVQP